MKLCSHLLVGQVSRDVCLASDGGGWNVGERVVAVFLRLVVAPASLVFQLHDVSHSPREEELVAVRQVSLEGCFDDALGQGCPAFHLVLRSFFLFFLDFVLPGDGKCNEG